MVLESGGALYFGGEIRFRAFSRSNPGVLRIVLKWGGWGGEVYIDGGCGMMREVTVGRWF